MDQRRSGILLHISSLPSKFGIGDLGPGAYWFADFLQQAGQSLWQVLPLNPTDPGYHHSPYSSFSAFAANVLFISPELLVREGLLSALDLRDRPDFPSSYTDYDTVMEYKRRILHRAHENFRSRRRLEKEFGEFRKNNSAWLRDYALFVAIKDHLGGAVWTDWPKALKERKGEALQDFEYSFGAQIERAEFLQFIFFRQWEQLREYCRGRGIEFIGDMPIYVNWDSADAWADTRNFKIDERYRPVGVAGVPPDYFSATGQRWGNPVYNWRRLKESRYAWWVGRLRHNLKLYDYVRIDHFRGFVQYWEIPSQEPLASKGKWMHVPTEDFFDTLRKNFKKLPLVAEDLGVITDDVRALMRKYDFPGMKVLLFAFGEDLHKHPYLPHNFERHCLVYTGTHDNNTVRGWFENEATPREKENFFTYISRHLEVADIPWAFVELAMRSKADTAIVPMQDVLGLGQEARFNKPATTQGNWRWRLTREEITPRVTQRLRVLAQDSDRLSRVCV
ncbi:MAG: 4-alpha-glucanotransferase [Candidatus Omnitrophica bacterium]|nr:4-alpha-glucanotransferase [Candidatus Omnitrophota bacterium]